jgi:hypothetical protein
MDHSPLLGSSAPLKLRLARLWWGFVAWLARSFGWLAGRRAYEEIDAGPLIFVHMRKADAEFEHRTGVGRMIYVWSPDGVPWSPKCDDIRFRSEPVGCPDAEHAPSRVSQPPPRRRKLL